MLQFSSASSDALQLSTKLAILPLFPLLGSVIFIVHLLCWLVMLLCVFFFCCNFFSAFACMLSLFSSDFWVLQRFVHSFRFFSFDFASLSHSFRSMTDSTTSMTIKIKCWRIIASEVFDHAASTSNTFSSRTQNAIPSWFYRTKPSEEFGIFSTKTTGIRHVFLGWWQSVLWIFDRLSRTDCVCATAWVCRESLNNRRKNLHEKMWNTKPEVF